MAEPTYPIPRAVVAAATRVIEQRGPGSIETRLVAGGSLAESDLRLLAADPDAIGSRWAGKVVGGLDQRRQALVASVLGSSTSRCFGVLDPEFDGFDLVTYVVRACSSGVERWRGGQWEPVIASAEPAGARFVTLDGDLLTDVIVAFNDGAGSVLLHSGTPRAWYGGRTPDPTTILAAAETAAPTGAVYAIVDDLDTTAVMDLIRVTPGPQAWVRRGGQWAKDSKVLSSLRGVDPPTVVEIDPADQDAVLAQVDAYDTEHPVKPITADGAAPRAAGLAVVAADTGRVFMLQRAIDPPDLVCPVCEGSGERDSGQECENCDGLGELDPDPAAGTWEFPGGKIDPEDDTAYDAAAREFAEETGQPAPEGQLVGVWNSPDGVYQGHVVLVDDEHAIEVHPDREPRGLINPDDPDGDRSEALAWWDPAHLIDNPAIRAELLQTLDQVLPVVSTVNAVRAVTAAAPAHSVMPRTLKNYWTRGAGAAKIRWGVGGDFRRCRRHLAKYLNPAQVSGACANLHKIATGTWPGKNRGH